MLGLLKFFGSLVIPHGFVVVRDRLRMHHWQREQQAVHAARRARIQTLREEGSTSRQQPWFDYEEAIAFLTRRGCDSRQVREGSMSADCLDYCLKHITKTIPSPPWVGLHIGNFVGVSLAFFAHAAYCAHPDSLMVAIDPNLTHRGISNPQQAVIDLLNHFHLQRRVMCIAGYSLEKSVSNDGIVFGDYDPVEHVGAEKSYENVLATLAFIARGRFDFCVLDGNHVGDYLRRELACVHRLLKPNGAVALDDISWQWSELQDVYESIDPFQFKRIAADGRVGLLAKQDS